MGLRAPLYGYVRPSIASEGRRANRALAVRDAVLRITNVIETLSAPANRPTALKFVYSDRIDVRVDRWGHEVLIEEDEEHLSTLNNLCNKLGWQGTLIVPTLDHILGLPGLRNRRITRLIEGSALAIIPLISDDFRVEQICRPTMRQDDFLALITHAVEQRNRISDHVNGFRAQLR